VAEHTFAGMRCSEVADLAPGFVLGALDAGTSGAVRRHLAECPETHPEMAELYSVVPALFEVVEPVAPPAGLKERILAAAAADTQRATDAQPAGDRAPAAEAPRTPAPPRVVPARPSGDDRAPLWTSAFRRPVWATVSLAAVLAVAVLGYQNIRLQQANDALAAYREGVVAVIEQAASPGAQLAVLSPPEGAGPSGFAAIGADGTIALVMRDLAPTTGTQVYETWLIAGDAAPVPVGEFTVASGGLGSFQTVQSGTDAGVVLALTLEPGPDSTTPTMPIVALGQAKAQQS
jgi:anti-sigma-K factor RskA/putative zinc finger protein